MHAASAFDLRSWLPGGLPPWARVSTARRVDEFQAIRSGIRTQQSGALHVRGGIDYRAVFLSSPAVDLGTVDMSVSWVVRAHMLEPALHLSSPPGGTYRLGRQGVATDGWHQAVLIPADGDVTRTVPPGHTTGVALQGRLWRPELGARMPHGRADVTVKLRLLSLDPQQMNRWGNALARFATATRPGADARLLAHAESGLASLMADLLMPQALARSDGQVDARRLALVEEWIEAHLDAPITLGRLCAVAGVGARCLQKSFEARRGLSPMRFVTERRIVEAHRRLGGSDAKPSVKAVALDLGFQHLGRFAEYYRQLLGESPSDTRDRARAAEA